MSTTKINGGTQIQSATITDTQIASAAAIATTKLADSANFILRTGAVPFTADQSHGGHLITNLGDAVSAQDAVNLRTLQLYAQGLAQKPTARAATTAALPTNVYSNGTSGVGATLTGSSNGALAAQDGVTL